MHFVFIMDLKLDDQTVNGPVGLNAPRHARHAVTRQNFLDPAPPRTPHRRPGRPAGSCDVARVPRKALICRRFRRVFGEKRVATAARVHRARPARAYYTLGF